MTLSTTGIVLRADCITENFGRVERGCLGDMGGVGYCVEFFRPKNIHKLLLDSLETLCYTRVSLYQYGLYMSCMSDPPPFSPAERKIEKFLNTPLHISADCDRLCGVDSARGRNGHRPLNCGNASPYGARGQLGNTTR